MLFQPISTSKKRRMPAGILSNSILDMLMTYQAQPSDINLVLNKLNSHHPDIQFTCEEFIDRQK